MTTPRAAADAALAMAAGDPERGRLVARAALADAIAAADDRAASVAERALGIATRALHDMEDSAVHFAAAAEHARAARWTKGEGEALMSLAPTLALLGRKAAAIAACDEAGARLRGLDRARLEAQRAGVLTLLDDVDAALESYARAIRVLRRARDDEWEARARNNRAMLLYSRGDLAAAARDLARAETLFARAGVDLALAEVRDNLGLVHAALGDLPSALQCFAAADAMHERLGVPDPVGLLDRATALLPARLVEEAEAAATAAVDALTGTGARAYLADAEVIRAEALLAGGWTAAARESAGAAAEHYRSLRDAGGRRRAVLLACRAEAADGRVDAALYRRVHDVARAARRAHQPAVAFDASLLAGDVASALGRSRAATHAYAPVAETRHRGPVVGRADGWYAEARLRLAGGDTRGATRALAAGIRVVDAHRATLGAIELRARSTADGTRLASLGLRLAVRSGRAEQVLTWAERWHAGALDLPRARPPDDPALAAGLTRLRQLATDLERAGRDAQPTSAIERAIARAEREVREIARTAAAPAGARPPDSEALADAVERHGVALVELADVDGDLVAVVIGGGRPSLHTLGTSAAAAGAVESMRMGLRRLAFGHGGEGVRSAARVAVDTAAARLDAQLLRPIDERVGGRPVVIVPTGALFVTPWSRLPSLRGRAVVAAPSAAAWARRCDPPRRRGHVVVAAGPGLSGAAQEVGDVAALYTGARQFPPADAHAGAVARALDRASVAHIAAHGRFRRDHPSFSSLELADGPLTVYDLERLRAAPTTVVLSACDLGQAGVYPGDELVGFAASLFALGTRSLVASVVPVDDAATRPLMVALHRRMLAGDQPAAALARVQADVDADELPASTAAASFVCFGAG